MRAQQTSQVTSPATILFVRRPSWLQVIFAIFTIIVVHSRLMGSKFNIKHFAQSRGCAAIGWFGQGQANVIKRLSEQGAKKVPIRGSDSSQYAYSATRIRDLRYDRCEMLGQYMKCGVLIFGDGTSSMMRSTYSLSGQAMFCHPAQGWILLRLSSTI